MSGRRTTENRSTRDARIVTAAERGVSTVAIASAEGISDRQVRRIVAAAATPSPELPIATATTPENASLTLSPFAIRDEAVSAHLESLAALRTLTRDARQEAVRLGSARAAAAVATSLLGLLQRTGMAPPTAASWWNEDSWRWLWLGMYESLVAAGVEDPAAFARDAGRRMGLELGLGDGAQLTGLGPRFDRETTT